MIPKKTRLPGQEFRSRGYRTATTRYFSLKMKPNQEGKTRIGVIANLAVHKNAAKRNFWKRQARATLAGLKNHGSDLLLILSPAANTATKKSFKTALRSAAEQLGVT